MSAAHESVTMVKDAIHNPGDARHFMRIARPTYPITASVNGIDVTQEPAISDQSRSIRGTTKPVPEDWGSTDCLIPIAMESLKPIKSSSDSPAHQVNMDPMVFNLVPME